MKAIITFHSIDDTGSVLSFPPRLFEELVAGLIAQKIHICSLNELLKTSAENAVSLTFDDGIKSVFNNALPVIKDANIPAHLYLTTGYVGKTNRWPTQPAHAPLMDMMSWQELVMCAEAGIRMENHTHTHPDLRELTESQILDECEKADDTIADRFGLKPEHFAYPYGWYNQKNADFLGKRYHTCVTTKLEMLASTHQNAELPRLDSYYMQHSFLCKNLYGMLPQTYLRIRALLRELKSNF